MGDFVCFKISPLSINTNTFEGKLIEQNEFLLQYISFN